MINLLCLCLGIVLFSTCPVAASQGHITNSEFCDSAYVTNILDRVKYSSSYYIRYRVKLSNYTGYVLGYSATLYYYLWRKNNRDSSEAKKAFRAILQGELLEIKDSAYVDERGILISNQGIMPSEMCNGDSVFMTMNLKQLLSTCFEMRVYKYFTHDADTAYVLRGEYSYPFDNDSDNDNENKGLSKQEIYRKRTRLYMILNSVLRYKVFVNMTSVGYLRIRLLNACRESNNVDQ